MVWSKWHHWTESLGKGWTSCVISRIPWIKLKFSRVKVCVVLRYSPSEGDEVKDRFWNNKDRILDRVGNGYRLCTFWEI